MLGFEDLLQGKLQDLEVVGGGTGPGVAGARQCDQGLPDL